MQAMSPTIAEKGQARLLDPCPFLQPCTLLVGRAGFTGSLDSSRPTHYWSACNSSSTQKRIRSADNFDDAWD